MVFHCFCALSTAKGMIVIMTLIRIYYRKPKEESVSINSLDLNPELLTIFHELGIIEIRDDRINTSQLQRFYKAIRLKTCLGLNLQGTAIILDLLDKIEELQAEIEILKRAR
jgi:hypothetical protein